MLETREKLHACIRETGARKVSSNRRRHDLSCFSPYHFFLFSFFEIEFESVIVFGKVQSLKVHVLEEIRVASRRRLGED